MSRNGAGVMILPTGSPVTTGTTIKSTQYNAATQDLCNELTNSIARDGQAAPTANLPMGGFKHTGCADASSLTDYATFNQVQNHPNWTFRNKIINGNFEVAQRGSSITLSGTNGASGYTLDQYWAQIYGGTTGSGTAAINVSQQSFTLGQTAVPGEPKYFSRIQATTLPTQGGTTSIIDSRRFIESVRTHAGKNVNLSFYAKGDTVRTYAVIVTQWFGTGGSPSSPVVAYQSTFTVTSSFQKFNFNFAMPSISGKTLGSNNDDSVQITYVLYKQDNTAFSDTLGAIGTWSTTPYFDLSQDQLEESLGGLGTPFEQRPISIEQHLCDRYLAAFGGSTGNATLAHIIWYSNTLAILNIAIPTNFRKPSAATLSYSSLSDFGLTFGTENLGAPTRFTLSDVGNKFMRYITESSITAGQSIGSAGDLILNGDATKKLYLSCEL